MYSLPALIISNKQKEVQIQILLTWDPFYLSRSIVPRSTCAADLQKDMKKKTVTVALQKAFALHSRKGWCLKIFSRFLC